MSQPRRRSALLGALLRSGDLQGGPEVLAEVRRGIVSGAVPPGSPIPLDDVADFFEVSRIPVREALKMLEGEGLVAHSQRSGYHVTALSPAELDEVYLVRGALERAAFGAAVQRASSADHARARSTLAAIDDAVGRRDPAAYQRSTRAFHEALLAPCAMPRLLHMLDVAWNLTEPAQAMMHVSQQQRDDLHTDHRELLEAFVAGDVARLSELAVRHHQRLTECVRTIG